MSDELGLNKTDCEMTGVRDLAVGSLGGSLQDQMWLVCEPNGCVHVRCWDEMEHRQYWARIPGPNVSRFDN